MTEEEFGQLLTELIENCECQGEYWPPEFENSRVNSFSSVGMLTMNEGIVVRLQSGEEFQVTIVRSR